MIRGNTEILFKWNLILIVLFLFSCKEDKSLVLNPLDNIDYEFKIFFLDESDDSGTGTYVQGSAATTDGSIISTGY